MQSIRHLTTLHMTENASLTASKPRFEILDGLRGVAAIIVVMFHLFETYSSGPTQQILNHGYLAVDIFFILSGFVIGYAYDERWSKGMSTWNFFKRRIVRLQPMVIMGSLIGSFWFFFGDAPAFSLVMQTPWWKVLVFMVLGCLMIPTTPSMDIRGWQEINSLNGVQWWNISAMCSMPFSCAVCRRSDYACWWHCRRTSQSTSVSTLTPSACLTDARLAPTPSSADSD